ncbi:MAG: tRNA (guanine(46)-N(7))-methyltransferase TrmB [Angustibacter sp.]
MGATSTSGDPSPGAASTNDDVSPTFVKRGSTSTSAAAATGGESIPAAETDGGATLTAETGGGATLTAETDGGVGEPWPRVRTVRRRARAGSGRRVLDELGPRYRIKLPTPPTMLDPVTCFGRDAPLVLDIGFGDGAATLLAARADPARDVLAVELHRPGAAALVTGLEKQRLGNVRVALADARDVVEALAGSSVEEIRVWFPDPWPKTRHRGRRLLNAGFLHQLAVTLVPGGLLHVATDWTPYAQQIRAAVCAEPLLDNPSGGSCRHPTSRPSTRFERRGMALGHPVHDILAYRIVEALGHPSTRV